MFLREDRASRAGNAQREAVADERTTMQSFSAFKHVFSLWRPSMPCRKLNWWL